MDDVPSGFAEAWRIAERIEGWLTRDQALVLFRAVRSLRSGSTVVEIGSHQGRSTVVLASALPAEARLVAVDPFLPDWRYGGPDTRERLLANLTSAGVRDRVELMTTTSRAAREVSSGQVELVYVDGRHDLLTVRDDLRWADRVPDGGLLLVHDAFGSLGVTLALLGSLPAARRLAYCGRTGSLARLEVRAPSPAERASWVRELPWFGRNLVVKVLLRLRLRPLARLLGHDGSADPF